LQLSLRPLDHCHACSSSHMTHHGPAARVAAPFAECMPDRSEVVVPNVVKGAIVGGPPRRFTFDHVYDTATAQVRTICTNAEKGGGEGVSGRCMDMMVLLRAPLGVWGAGDAV